MPQLMLSDVLKGDWQRSAFDQSTRRMLVVGDERAFFMTTDRTGAEYRVISIEAGEAPRWARYNDGANTWFALTSKGRLLSIDDQTGQLSTIADIPKDLPVVGYRSGQIDGQFVVFSATEIIVHMSAPVTVRDGEEEVQTSAQYLVWVDIAKGKISKSTRIDTDQAITDGRTNLFYDPYHHLIGLYTPGEYGELHLFDGRQKQAYRCTVDIENLVDVRPFRQGVLISSKDQMQYRPFNSAKTGCPIPQNNSAHFCSWHLSKNIGGVVATFFDSGERRALFFGSKMEGLQIQLPETGCGLKSKEVQNLGEHFYPWNKADREGWTKNDAERGDFVAGYDQTSRQWTAVLGGTLVSIKDSVDVKQVLLDRHTGALALQAYNGTLIASTVLGPVRVWDGKAVEEISYDYSARLLQSFFYSRPFAFASDRASLVTIDLKGRLRWSRSRSGPTPQDQETGLANVVGVCASATADRMVTADETGLVSLLKRDGNGPLSIVDRLQLNGEKLGYAYKVSCDRDADYIAIGGSLTNEVTTFKVTGDRIIITGHATDDREGESGPNQLSPDGRMLAIGAKLYNRGTSGAFEFVHRFVDADRLAFFQGEGDERGLLVIGPKSRLAKIDAEQAPVKVEDTQPSLGEAQDGVILDAKTVVLLRNTSEMEFYHRPTHQQIGRLQFGSGRSWLFSQADGRFDTNQFSGPAPAVWLMPDDPVRPLPPEIFTRDYYEPDLFSRLKTCIGSDDACSKSFKSVRSLVDLNRVQPDIKISAVRKSDADGGVFVDLEVSAKSDPSQRNGKTKTDVFDVRLFRDGQLVGQWPNSAGSLSDDVQEWRRASHVALDRNGTSKKTFFVHIPVSSAGKPVSLSAYAFNEDRVKSATAIASYSAPSRDAQSRRPKAYVISVGVNKYADSALDLNYAAADARVIQSSLKDITGFDVVSVPILSDQDVQHATKSNIKEVLLLLSGDETVRTDLRPKFGKVVDDLVAVTPDDILVLAFSGHGYTNEGKFYLLPSDSGSEDIEKRSFSSLISSEELTDWIRSLDARNIVLIIDACHSAAGVPPGFKPGPMGDGGLGQLAYDKGMRLLAATQASDVALESGVLKQGLLSYALKEGLEWDGTFGRADRDQNGEVTMGEWLSYAQGRVPSLYSDVLSGKIRATKDPTVNAILYKDVERHAQTPAIFDFFNGEDATVKYN